MSRTPIPAEAFNHGDPRRYRRGCQCRPCVTSASNETRRNAYLRHTGRGSLISPDQAAAHIQLLRASGMQDRDIMAAASIVHDVFYRIMRGQRPIRRATERRILNVKAAPTPAGCGAHTPALGTTRRLQVLAANGWPAAELGRRAGKHKQYIVSLQNGATTKVRMWVADYVRQLYQELSILDPEQAGVRPTLVNRTKALAASKGWACSDYWDEDDFDSPDFKPAAVATLCRNDLAAVRRDEVEHLASYGYNAESIAARLGMHIGTVRSILAELRTGQRRDRSKAAA